MTSGTFLLFLCVIFAIVFTWSSASYQEKTFLANVTQNYDKSVRPVFRTSEKLTINVSVGLLSIINLDEKLETLRWRGWVSMTWQDNYLRWNLTADSPYLLYLPVTDIWTPTLFLTNSVADQKYLTDKKERAVISNTGLTFYTFTGRFETHCKINIGKFPFDVQVCKIGICPYPSIVSGEYIDVMDNSVLLDIYEENGEWILLDTSLKLGVSNRTGYRTDTAVATLTLQRRTTFYILNNILPVVFLSFLNTFVFLLPEESGEKMSLCVSILLSYAVFITLINSYLPANSDHLCFFSVYLVLLVLISTLTCLLVIFILALHNRLKKGKVVPKWLTTLAGFSSNTGTSVEYPCRTEIRDTTLRRVNVSAFVMCFLLTCLSNFIFFLSVCV